MNIYIHQAYKGQRVFKDYTILWLECFFSELKKNRNLKNKELLNLQELSLVYVDSKTIKKLNKDYRGKNRPTDVLSFSGDGFISLGEIIICQEVLKEKTKNSHLPLKLFTQLMICHSSLHLLGYTHEDSRASEDEMITLQNKTLKKVASKLSVEHKNQFEISL